jgi:hypothetical protein
MSGGPSPDQRHLTATECYPPRWLVFALILGLYLSARGYHSFDGDQAYRLPLLLHRQDARLFADDSFVRAFDEFNPHRGSMIVLDLATRPLGVAAGLFSLFVLTLAATCRGVEVLARGICRDGGRTVGLVAVGLVLAAKAGNIGTNHLFEAMVLDRLMAFALGWLALAQTVVEPQRTRWRTIAAIAGATWIHPSAGLQLAMVIAASWAAWLVLGRWTEINIRLALAGCLGMAVAVVPGIAINLAPGKALLGDMPAELFWLLSVELQSPQHMLPHLWRMPQWLGFASYLVMASLALLNVDRIKKSGASEPRESQTLPDGQRAVKIRLVVTLAIIIAGLSGAWIAIEVLHLVRVTVFQPFRMATVARGIALVMLSGRVVALWRTGSFLGSLRAILICASVAGDWRMVVVTIAGIGVSLARAARVRLVRHARWQAIDLAVYAGLLALGINFLGHHDTESGHVPLLMAVVLGIVAGLWKLRQSQPDRGLIGNWTWTPRRFRLALVAAWALPLVSLFAGLIPADHRLGQLAVVRSLINRCRFPPVPADDIERLAVWCRDHTPERARFVGPPGPKTFRLWSQRNLAFNRAASPYHAEALADWFARFSDHVDFHGTPAAFVRAYVADRHGFEARYDRLGAAKQAALARRQRAEYVVALAPEPGQHPDLGTRNADPLELLHVEGRYAAYRVKPAQFVQRQQ